MDDSFTEIAYFNLTNFTPTKMTIKLTFAHSEYISDDPMTKDRLLVKILQPNAFITSNATNSLPKDYIFGNKVIP